MEKLNIFAGYKLNLGTRIESLIGLYTIFKTNIQHNIKNFYIEKISYFESDTAQGGRWPPMGPIPMFARCPICRNVGPTRVEMLDANYSQQLENYNYFHKENCNGTDIYTLNLQSVLESEDVTMFELIREKLKREPLEINEIISYEQIFPKRGEAKVGFSTKPNFFMNAVQVNIVVPKEFLKQGARSQTPTTTILKDGTVIISNIPYYCKNGDLLVEYFLAYLFEKMGIQGQGPREYQLMTLRTSLSLVDGHVEYIDPSFQGVVNDMDLGANIIVNKPSVQINLNKKMDPSINKLQYIVQRVCQSFKNGNYVRIRIKSSIYQKNVIPTSRLKGNKKQPSCRKEDRSIPFSFVGEPPKRNSYVNLQGVPSKTIFQFDKKGNKIYLYEPCTSTLSVKKDIHGHFKYRYKMPPSRILDHLLKRSGEEPRETINDKLEQFKKFALNSPINTILRKVLFGFPNNLFPQDTPTFVNYKEGQDLTVTGEDRFRKGLFDEDGNYNIDKGEVIEIVKCYLKKLERDTHNPFKEWEFHFKIEIVSKKSIKLLYPQSGNYITTIKIDSKWEFPNLEDMKIYSFMCNYKQTWLYKTNETIYKYDSISPFLFIHPIRPIRTPMTDQVIKTQLEQTEF